MNTHKEGRKKPRKLKEQLGNPGKQKLEATHEPVFPAEDPRNPGWLQNVAKEEWQRIAPVLEAQGLLTVADRRALEAYCMAYSRWRQAEAMLDQAPAMVGKSTTGYLYPVPWIAISQRYMELMLKIASAFGFTPVSRSRINSLEAGAKEADEDEQFFNAKALSEGSDLESAAKKKIGKFLQ